MYVLFICSFVFEHAYFLYVPNEQGLKTFPSVSCMFFCGVQIICIVCLGAWGLFPSTALFLKFDFF